MEALYVCAFSNGHIKVGRSVDPTARIATHAERVSCMGVDLVDHRTFWCLDPSRPREAQLIARCAEAADERFQHEWFSGLEFSLVCGWAAEAASGQPEGRPRSKWSALIGELMAAGLSQATIALRCDCKQTTISALYNGRSSEPLHSLGERLLSLHADRQIAVA